MLVQAPLAPGPVALARLLADPRDGRPGDDRLAERLGEQRLDVAHRQPAQEGEDDQRLERARPRHPLAEHGATEAELGGAAQPRPLQLERPARRLDRPRLVAVAVGDRILAALVAGTAEKQLRLRLQSLLQDQAGAQPRDRLDRSGVLLDAGERLLQLTPEPLARGYPRHRGVPPFARLLRSSGGYAHNFSPAPGTAPRRVETTTTPTFSVWAETRSAQAATCPTCRQNKSRSTSCAIGPASGSPLRSSSRCVDLLPVGVDMSGRGFL